MAVCMHVLVCLIVFGIVGGCQRTRLRQLGFEV